MANRGRPKYVSGWVSQQQYDKVSALATLKDTSRNGILCELIDSVSVEIVMPQHAKNDVGDLAVTANAVLP